MNKIIVAVCTFLSLATAALGQVPTSGNAFIGYSYLSADQGSNGRANLNGWNGSIEGKVFPFIGIVGDFSGHYGSGPVIPNGACTTVIGGTCSGVNTSTSIHNFLFGPRVSISVGKIRPFAEAMFGASHINESASLVSASDTSFAYALGGGVDYHLIPLISWRVQGDFLQTRFFSNTQNNVRISTGIVIHF